jgi:hypothetical protein
MSRVLTEMTPVAATTLTHRPGLARPPAWPNRLRSFICPWVGTSATLPPMADVRALPTPTPSGDHVRMTRIEGLLEGVDYHQFFLEAGDPTEYPSYPREGPPNRLLAATDTGHAVCITTGIAMGVVQLAIEFLDGPPSGMDDSHEWEAVAEFSFEAGKTETTAVVVLLMADTKPPFRSFELPQGSGWYRMRGHATGRSLDFDVVVSEPQEHHLLQLW